MGSILSVLITAGLGTWLAYVWQQRSARQARYFEAAKIQYEQMLAAAKRIADVSGRRIAASNRLCLLRKSNPHFAEAQEEYRQSVIEWNRISLQIDLDIRTLYRSANLNEFEKLRERIVGVSGRLDKALAQAGDERAQKDRLLKEIALLRHEIFSFLQGMVRESNLLFRQMHFGVALKYERSDIRHYSTNDLLIALFTGYEEGSTILRAPSDFGLPVGRSDARFGIDQH